MYKRLLLLNGSAIFAVVSNHAAGWGQIGLFWWAYRYLPVSVPDYTQLGSLSYYFLLFIRQLAIFSVPAFFFISGFFVSYAALDRHNPINWTFVWKRIKILLIPYLIWTIVIIGGDILQGKSQTPLEYLKLFFTEGVIGPYWFVPALCYSYLISPIVVRFVQWKWKLALAIAGLIQLIPIMIGWLAYAGINLPWMATITKLFPDFSPLQWIFFFTLGISAGFHIDGLMQWLLKYRNVLFLLVVFSGLSNILELDYLFRSPLHICCALEKTITYNIYATTFILWFLALLVIPFSKNLAQLGAMSYGIYLLHFPVIEVTSRVIYHIIPQLLAYQIVFVPLLVMIGVGLPVFFMTIVRRSPVKKYYRYLFG